MPASNCNINCLVTTNPPKSEDFGWLWCAPRLICFILSTCTLNFFWFLSWTLLQGSAGTASSSIEGLICGVIIPQPNIAFVHLPFPVLQSLPSNLAQGGLLSSQDESGRQGRQHSHSLEVKQFWCKKLPNLVYQKLKMQFAFFFLHISRKLFVVGGYNLIKHKYGWF